MRPTGRPADEPYGSGRRLTSLAIWSVPVVKKRTANTTVRSHVTRYYLATCFAPSLASRSVLIKSPPE